MKEYAVLHDARNRKREVRNELLKRRHGGTFLDMILAERIFAIISVFNFKRELNNFNCLACVFEK
jgi:hypothetical protein